MPLNGPAKPHPKAAQLARGERRYRRKVASPKQWQMLREEKATFCRCCNRGWPLELHHLVSRIHGGDDVADNLVPLCGICHGNVTGRHEGPTRTLLASLTDSEYAYCVTKGGEAFFELAYGLEYSRV